MYTFRKPLHCGGACCIERGRVEIFKTDASTGGQEKRIGIARDESDFFKCLMKTTVLNANQEEAYTIEEDIRKSVKGGGGCPCPACCGARGRWCGSPR